MTPALIRLEAQLSAAVVADRPVVPAAGHLLWTWFLDLSTARRNGFSGPEAIAFKEIEAYGRAHRLPLRPHHVEILRSMDRALLRAHREQGSRAPDGVPRLPRTSKQEISPEAFDVIFGED